MVSTVDLYGRIAYRLHVSRAQTKKWIYEHGFGLKTDPWISHLVGQALDEEFTEIKAINTNGQRRSDMPVTTRA